MDIKFYRRYKFIINLKKLEIYTVVNSVIENSIYSLFDNDNYK